MTSLKIDSAAKTIEAEIQLKGEAGPIHIAVRDYAIVAAPEGARLSAGDVTVNREWMDVLAKELLAKGVVIPHEAAKWMGLVL